jgi:hypothetical protein
MIKFNELPLYKQAVRVYLLSILISIIFSPLFDKLYIILLKPIMVGGDLFFSTPDWLETLINGMLFGFYFFLPFFVFWFIKNKQWQVWIIGAAFPFLLALVGGLKDMFWAIVLSAVGWGLAQGILFIKKKKVVK